MMSRLHLFCTLYSRLHTYCTTSWLHPRIHGPPHNDPQRFEYRDAQYVVCTSQRSCKRSGSRLRIFTTGRQTGQHDLRPFPVRASIANMGNVLSSDPHARASGAPLWTSEHSIGGSFDGIGKLTPSTVPAEFSVGSFRPSHDSCRQERHTTENQ